MKSYSDLEQSKKLAEILPIESADMYYMETSCNNYTIGVLQRMERDMLIKQAEYYKMLPCWSLTALLKYLSEIKPQEYTPTLFPSEGKWILHFVEYGHGIVCAVTCDNPVDVCYELILKLHELNLL